jgi:hypothetical protein
MSSVSEHILAPSLRKLEKRVMLSAEDRAAFLGLPFSVKELKAGSYIVRERDEIKNCCFLLSGFAFRSKIVGNGGRQILSIHIPGDVVDIQHAVLRIADHNIQMLTAGNPRRWVDLSRVDRERRQARCPEPHLAPAVRVHRSPSHSRADGGQPL